MYIIIDFFREHSFLIENNKNKKDLLKKYKML